ncbi:MAG: SEC-C metal-binding domain-containing protein [Pseudomonadota bacterium]
MTLQSSLTIKDVRRALGFAQPFLKFAESDDAVYARGSFIVSDGAHTEGAAGRFEIECVFFKDFPKREPLVFEIGERIPRTADRHMYLSGLCCLCVWQEWLARASTTTFQAFCDGPLYNFFLSQIHFEQTKEWPFDERSHGAKGVAESISSMIGFDLDEQQANRYAQAISAEKVKGHWPCPCGSSKKLRECHLEQIIEIRERLGVECLRELRTQLKSLMKAERGK